MPKATSYRIAGGLCLLAALLVFRYVQPYTDAVSLISCIVFSPDGKYLVAARHDAYAAHTPGKNYLADISRTISVINTDNWQLAGVLESDLKAGNQRVGMGLIRGAGHTMTFVSDSRTLAVIPHAHFSGTPIRLYDVTTRQLLSTIEPDKPLANITSTPDGRIIAAGSMNGVEVHGIPEGKMLFTKEMYALAFRGGPAIALSPDGRFLATGSSNTAGEVVTLWALPSGSALFNKKLNVIEDGDFVAFHPTKPLLGVATAKWLRLYDLEGKQVSEWPLTERPGLPESPSIYFSPDGATIAVRHVYQESVIFDVEKGIQIGRLSGHGAVQCMAYSPDGRYLATGAWDRSINIWDAHSLAHLRTIKLPGPDPSPSYLWILPTGLTLIGVTLLAWSFRRRSSGDGDAT